MTEDSILDNINSPSDLKKLGLDELNKLSDGCGTPELCS